jgi:hypothetical protein
MTDARRTLSYLLLVLVAVVTAGGAFLAVYYAPSQPATSLSLAAKATNAATSYTEDLKETAPTGTAQLHLVLQAPSRAAGYQQARGLRSYFVVVNDTVYETVARSINSSITSHRFGIQHVANPLPQVDPLPSYLAVVSRAKAIHRNGDVYSFSLKTNTGATALLRYTVTGDYVSGIDVSIPGAVTHIDVTNINTSPPIQVPPTSSISSGSPTTSTTTP